MSTDNNDDPSAWQDGWAADFLREHGWEDSDAGREMAQAVGDAIEASLKRTGRTMDQLLRDLVGQAEERITQTLNAHVEKVKQQMNEHLKAVEGKLADCFQGVKAVVARQDATIAALTARIEALEKGKVGRQ